MDYLLNIKKGENNMLTDKVLNLIINGLPSKLLEYNERWLNNNVLNLIINGLPSKQLQDQNL